MRRRRTVPAARQCAGRARADRGFSLVEVVIVLAIFGVLAALLAPAVFQSIQATNDTGTRNTMRAISEAALGNPARGSQGYLSDVGALPTDLADLITKPASVPVYTTTGHVGLVGMGWRGPYVDRAFFAGDEFKDEWGGTFVWGGPSGVTNAGIGQIRSLGRDGVVANGDDILFPLDPVEINGTLLVTVYVNDTPNPQAVTLTVYRTTAGAQAVHATQTVGVGFTGFSFAVHQGTHAVTATHTVGGTTVTRTDTVAVVARSQQQLAIRLRTTAVVTP